MKITILTAILFLGSCHTSIKIKSNPDHLAGYQWAKRNQIKRADDCGGKSKAFVRGCRIQVRETAIENCVTDIDCETAEAISVAPD
jgi:hypothetical protein